MRSVVARLLAGAAVATLACIGANAQQPQSPPPDPTPPPGVPTHALHMNDPRVGLKAGIHDAGEAAKNMERVSSLSKPSGFFDPKHPAGEPLPGERRGGEGDTPRPPGDQPANGSEGQPPAPSPQERQRASSLNFSNSDLAFSRNHVVIGNFNGFNTYDVDSTKRPRLLASAVCPG